eukprot:TRINITY_DN303_c0_g2_i1.p1 TRINITY_DN303_c0_g2~~TRINITY_DN303_c0_g2_i1.p1  ORF type:complete len:463 (+),score=208.61 TRINITY_DN303_c0_g2_i1:31-1389(+)
MSIENNLGTEWRYLQGFIDRTPTEEITTIEFDPSGNFIATGDRSGKVQILHRDNNCNDNYELHDDSNDNNNNSNSKITREYSFYTEFQSHEPEFDYLKSLEIEAKINKIKWCSQVIDSHLLLTTNDKTIKLWKIFNKQTSTSKMSNNNNSNNNNNNNVNVCSRTRRVYADAHAYHINSISLNSDGETFLSADDLRINLWNMNVSEQSFNIVDIKPVNMEELTEVITSAEFHPQHCNIFLYSSSKGTLKLGDLREAALCDNHSKIFEEEEDPGSKSFFSEIISSVSDIKFSRDGRYIVSRDYLTLKIWDLNMESKPIKTLRIHDQLRSKLCDLYENDCIFDKFEVCFNPNGSNVITGSYNNNFSIFDWKENKSAICLEAARPGLTRSNKRDTFSRVGANRNSNLSNSASNRMNENLDFTRKCLHLACHPRENLVAVSSASNLSLFVADQSSSQ